MAVHDPGWSARGTYTSVMSLDGSSWLGKAEIVYRQLRDDIESGVFEPGRALPEIELVEYTGASRTPVREAVRRLAADGLLDLEPRRAPTVSLISLRSARELSNFRVLLESEAISLVADLAISDRSIHQDFQDLLDEFLRLDASTADIAVDGPFRPAADRFDALLAAHTPNEYLRRAVLDLRPHTARLRTFAHNDPSRLRQAVKEHVTMCEAILDGDPDRSATAIREHLQHVEEAIFRHLFDHSSNVLVN